MRREEALAAARAALPLAPVALALALVAAIAHGRTVRYLVDAWRHDPYYGHGVLVLALALVLAWRARGRVLAEPAEPAAPRALLAFAAPVALYAFAHASLEPFVYSLSLVALVAASLVYLAGWRRARHLMGACAFLLLAVPMPGVTTLGVHLQGVAASGAAALLGALGFAVETDGFVLVADGARFEVAPLCSGLSGVLGIVTLVAYVAAAHARGVAWRAALLAAAVPLAVAANVLRVALLVGVGARWGDAAATGPLHAASGVAVFALALAAALLVGAAARRAAGGAAHGG